ncbi:MAG: magnesium protoporphyrin IX methyltransferase, partial [Aphanizomenon sp.]
AYLHSEADIIKILQKNGFSIERTAMTRTNFYFSRLLEATRTSV